MRLNASVLLIPSQAKITKEARSIYCDSPCATPILAAYRASDTLVAEIQVVQWSFGCQHGNHEESSLLDVCM